MKIGSSLAKIIMITALALGLTACHKHSKPKTLLQQPKFYITNPAMVEGNPTAPVTIVEFFDYHCHACYYAYPQLQKYLELNPNVRIVLRPVAILGPISVITARAAVASIKQGYFSSFTRELMNVGPALDEHSALLIAHHMGMNTQTLNRDLNSNFVSNILDENAQLSKLVKLKGTPTYLVARTTWHNGQVTVGKVLYIPGAMNVDTINQVVNKVLQ